MSDMLTRRTSPRNERGETLIELLVAIAILGIAAVSILAALEMSVKSSDLGRKQADYGSYVRSLAEEIQNTVASGGYQTCGGTAYLTGSVKTAAGLPSTYPVTTASL